MRKIGAVDRSNETKAKRVCGKGSINPPLEGAHRREIALARKCEPILQIEGVITAPE
jgi:hypothetical protein